MSNRTILITGGSGKFGQILVRHFLNSGDTVIATCRSVQSLEGLNNAFATFGSRFIAIACDFSTEGAAEQMVADLTRRGVYPDCLVNNARSLNFLEVNKDGVVARKNFTGELLLDVVVPYELTMAIFAQPNGVLRRVVNIGSQYGSVAANLRLYKNPATQSPLQYSVAKAALAHLTKELAVRLAPFGIQVNCIAFGGVEGRVDSEFKNRYAKLCPMGRMLHDSEISGPVDMLLTEQFNAMTGHVLAVDGGWTIW